MHQVKRIVCLANSRKLGGRCIAGREWNEEQRVGRWVRPVSAREKQEVSFSERQYENGSDPNALDIMDLPVLEPRPEGYQTENWLLDPGIRWRPVGSFSRLNLPELLDPVVPLWINGQSTRRGLNDAISLELMDAVCDSLRLIHVKELNLSVIEYIDIYGRSIRRVQGHFAHAGIEYKLRVTDSVCEQEYLRKPNGAYEFEECYLTISLTEPFQGCCYKLIAAIIAAE